MFTRLSFRIAATAALIVSAFALTPLGAGAQTSGAGISPSLRSPAWMRQAPIRAAVPTGGALSEAELPGASNPSEPYAAASQGLGSNQLTPTQLQSLGLSVNPVTGDLSLSLGDLSVPERGVPLGLSLTYNSYFASTDGPFGRGWSFNAGMRLTRASDGSVTVSQENGSQVTFRHKSTGYAAPPRVIASLRVASGLFVFTRGTRSGACPRYSRACVDFVFNPPTSTTPGRLVRVSAPDGGLTLTYSGNRLTTVSDPPGRTLTFSYGGGRVQTVGRSCCGGGGGGGGGGGSASMSYDANGNLKRFTDASGASYRFRYTSGHALSAVIDPRGAETDIAYDTTGRVQSVTDPAGETDFGHPSGQTVTLTRTGGYTAVGHFTDGQMTRIDEGGTPGAPLATTLFTYDPATLGPTAITDPDGHTSTMTYDNLGHRTSFTDPLGHTSSYHFDAVTGKIRATDAMGNVSTAATDASGRVTSIIQDSSDSALAETTTLHYGSAKHPGDVTSVTDPEGHLWLFTYDQFGNPTGSTDPLGNKSTVGYDRMGRPTINTAANGYVSGANPDDFSTTYTYDLEGRVLSTTDPVGNTKSFSYDPAGNVVTDVEGGDQTSYGYDTSGRLTSITRPDGSHSTIHRDVAHHKGEVCDDGNNCEDYTFDVLGRVTSVTDPLGNQTSYTYSAGGLLLTKTDANGVTATYTHDADGRVTGISYSDGVTHPVTYHYDADGQLDSMTDATGTSTITYDSLGRQKKFEGLGMESDYAYDRLNHVTQITLNSTVVANQAYDAAGRLVQLRDRFGNATAFTYDPSSNVTQTLFPGGSTDSNGYDAAGRTVSFTIAQGVKPAVVSANWHRDLLGQITAAIQNGLGQPDQTYTYKHKGQMSSVQSNPLFVDSRGNVTQNPAGDTFTYDAADRLVSESEKNAAGTTDWLFGFDGNGQRTSATTLDGTQSHDFVWDGAGNLASFTDGTTSETNTYDGLGRRTLLTSGGNTLLSVWGSTHATPRLAAGGGPDDPTESDTDCGGGIVCALARITKPGMDKLQSAIPTLAPPSGPIAIGGTVFLYGPDGLPVEQVDSSNQPLFYHHDYLGSTRAVTDVTGDIVEVASYDEYGNVAYHSGAVTVPFGFAGSYTDPVSRLVLFGGNLYDPPTGQFLSAAGNPLYNAENSGANPLFEDKDRTANPLYGQSGLETTSPIFSGDKRTCASGQVLVWDVGSCSASALPPPFTPDAVGQYPLGSARGGSQHHYINLRAGRTCRYWPSVCFEPGAASIGLSSYPLGGGDPINGAIREFSPAQDQLKQNPRH